MSLPPAANKKAYLALGATSIIWGTTWVAMKYAVKGIPPFQLAAMRHLVSGSVFVLFFLLIKKEKLPTLAQFIKLMILGTIAFVMANGISTWSLQYISSGLGALIGSLYPLSVVIIEFFFFNNKKINSTTFLGILLGIIGIVLVFYDHAFEVHSHYYFLGVLLALVAMLSWSVASILIAKKYIKINTYYSTGWQMLISFISCALLSFIFEKPIPLSQISQQSLLSLVYLIIMGSFIAMICFVYTMKHLNPAIAVLYAYINPIIAMLLGSYMLKEKLTTIIIIGSLITLVGVFLVNYSFKKQAAVEAGVNPVLEG
jgi:drug/metabolite transporter (DMT)-like permease